MRHAFFTLMIFLLLVFAGCSSSSNNPTQPAAPDLPEAACSFDGTALCYQGTFEIDLETQAINQIENRQSDFVYDITGFLPDKCPGGCFRFSIVGVVGTVLEIELTLENPLTIQVYDARVQYLDLFGKTVLNPDSYTDFLGTPITKIYPFTAYAKDVPDRAFPVGPGGIDTETMFLDFPPGAPSAVNYAITAHLPGHTPEPYEVSEMSQSGTLTPTGGSAIIRCKVDDHQDNISGVYMNAIPFTGAPVQLIFNDPLYEVTISNTAGASEGIYNQLMMALSPNPQNISTYNYVEITVSGGGDRPVADFTANPYPDALTCQHIGFDASSSYDPGGNNIVEYQWDWDYTGVPAEFIADVILDTPYAKYQYITEGSHTTGLKVVNDASPPQTSEVSSLTHELTQPPAADYDSKEVHKVSTSGSDEIWMPGSNAIVVDSSGVVHIFSKVYPNLVHQTWDNGVTSEVVIDGMTNYAHQSAQIDSNDVIHLVWYSDSVLKYATSSDGFSSHEIIASQFENNPYSYCMGINGQDELMVLYYEAFSDTHPLMYILKDESGWAEPTLLTNPPHETGSSGSELAIMLACAGTPGYGGRDFHAVWTQQFTEGYMNPVVTYSKFDGETETWSTPEYAADGLTHYQDWSDVDATEDGDVFIGASYHWDNSFVPRKDGVTGDWNIWMIAQTSHDEYTSTIGANNDGTVCIAYWERIGYPDPDPFEVHYKVFHESMSQSEVDAIDPMPLDPTAGTYEYRYCDIFQTECNFYCAFLDKRDTSGGAWSSYFGRISHE